MTWFDKLLKFLLGQYQKQVVDQEPIIEEFKPEIRRHLFTKNYSNRIKDIDAVVIHSMYARDYPGKEFDAQTNMRVLLDYGVSAHYIIDREGVIYKLVPEKYKAWHAGYSSLYGVSNVNQFSIGIELLNKIGDDFTEMQYKSLIWLCKDIQVRYAIGKERFVGHDYISPGRKQDPGPTFNWDKLRNSLT